MIYQECVPYYIEPPSALTLGSFSVRLSYSVSSFALVVRSARFQYYTIAYAKAFDCIRLTDP